MATLLGIPFDEFMPELLKRNISTAGQALIDWIDTDYEALEEEILEMYWFKLPERCPAIFLNELGNMLNANIKFGDTERQKRRKIKNAIATHKIRGSWTNDVKIRIDNITGYSAALYAVAIEDSDDAILLGYETTDPTAYWSTMQGDNGADDLLGMWMVGDFTEVVIPGNVYIDCHEGVNVSTLTAAEIAQIVAEIELDVCPAYMVIYLGYVNVSDEFVVYSGGIIG